MQLGQAAQRLEGSRAHDAHYLSQQRTVNGELRTTNRYASSIAARSMEPGNSGSPRA